MFKKIFSVILCITLSMCFFAGCKQTPVVVLTTKQAEYPTDVTVIECDATINTDKDYYISNEFELQIKEDGKFIPLKYNSETEKFGWDLDARIFPQGPTTITHKIGIKSAYDLPLKEGTYRIKATEDFTETEIYSNEFTIK